MTPQDFSRLESKVDQLTDAVNRLVLIEERQMTQGQRIGALEQRAAVLESAQVTAERNFANAIATAEAKAAEATMRVDRKVDKWVNFGIGAWSLAATGFAVWQTIHPGLK